MSTETISEKIKLPSNWSLVTPDSIWRHIVAISKTGSVFTKQQLINSGLYTQNDDNISRNLAYLKYLGIVDEERGKGKDQKFKVVDRSEVKNLMYEMKANRIDSAKAKFKVIIERHELYTSLIESFFGSEKEKTFIDLEHFLKDNLPGKAPLYYQKGGQFIINLLQSVGLTKIEGNDIVLNRDRKADISSTDAVHEGDSEEKKNDEEKKSPRQSSEDQQIDKYSINIKTPNMNFTMIIKSLSDINIIETILDNVKKELSNEESK